MPASSTRFDVEDRLRPRVAARGSAFVFISFPSGLRAAVGPSYGGRPPPGGRYSPAVDRAPGPRPSPTVMHAGGDALPVQLRDRPRRLLRKRRAARGKRVAPRLRRVRAPGITVETS